jgi:hypothetical protein
MTGSCSCRAVKYRLLAKPMFVNCCHCLDCQRQNGGAFAINAIIETGRIEIVAGTPEPVPMPTDSGRPHDIYRCPTCRVALWSDYGRRAGLRFVRVATLDEPHVIAPDAHIYTRFKVPWLTLPVGVPAFAEFYDLPKQWPEESFARLKAAMSEPRRDQ